MSNTVQPQEFSDVHRKQSTISSALEKIRNGFCLKSELTAGERGFIFEKFAEATIIEVSSVRSRGSKHFSIYDLIGQSVKGMVYLVIDQSRFRSAISSKLESEFLRKNNDLNSGLRCAFTNFMHENDLHWSMCCGQKAPLRRKEISAKLKVLSEITGKSRTDLLDELLDKALTEVRAT